MKTLNVCICPHDFNPKTISDWMFFLVYLSRKVGVNLSPETSLNFKLYYESFPKIKFSYSSPLDALKLHKERGFIPVAGNDNYDEVVFITQEDNEINNYSGKKIASVENQFATFLGEKILKEQGIEDFELYYYYSWLDVINAVKKKEVDMGFLYMDFYDHLAESSKKGIKEIFRSDTKLFSHLFMISPEEKELREKILDVLLNLDEKGKDLAKNIKINQFYEVSSIEEIENLASTLK